MSPPRSAGAGRRRSQQTSLWRFGPESASIVVRNAEAVLAHLPLFLGGWPPRWIDPESAAAVAADIDIVEQPDGSVDIDAASHHARFAGAIDAANGLAGALISAFIRRHRDMVCLHAGSAMVGGGLVVLIGGSNAGKSSVALQLAAAGYRLFGDDRIAIDLGDAGAPRGLCLGLMPKVRLPLPPDCGARFAEFVEGYSEVQDETAAYLKPWEGEAATFGETARLAALVVLNRSDGVQATLDRLGRAALLRAMIENVTAPQLDAESLIVHLDALAQSVPGYALGFGSSREAAALLGRALREAASDG